MRKPEYFVARRAEIVEDEPKPTQVASAPTPPVGGPIYRVIGPYANPRAVYQSRTTARQAMDRLDNKYGGYAHKIIEVPAGSK